MSSVTSDRPAVLPVPRRPVGSWSSSTGRTALFGLLASSGWVVSAGCLLLDLVCWVGIYLLCGAVRRGIDPGTDGLQVSAVAIQFAASVLCLQVIGGYDRKTNFVSLPYMSEHFITLLAASAIGALVIYVGRAFGQIGIVSSSVLLGSELAFAPVSLVCRRALRQVVQARVGHAPFLVLGAGEAARGLHAANRASSNPQLLRFVDPALTGGTVAARADGDPAALIVEPWTFGQFADELAGSAGVVVAEDARQLSDTLLEWLSRLHYEHVRVYTLETFYGQVWRRVPVRTLDATWPLRLEAHLAHSSVYAHAKRLMDIVAAGAALLVLGPFLLVLCLLIRLESGSPTVFRQMRVGRDRAPFTVYKFRTMFNRTVAAEGSLYTATDDPRITRLGRSLRKLRLDELPQLWNVLRGDMSLIGPRAEWDRLVGKYEAAIPFYHFRHLVKPGITGWAQVSYPYGGSWEDAVQKLEYDLYYIRHYSLRLDAMIVLKTLHTMLWGKGQ